MFYKLQYLIIFETGIYFYTSKITYSVHKKVFNEIIEIKQEIFQLNYNIYSSFKLLKCLSIFLIHSGLLPKARNVIIKNKLQITVTWSELTDSYAPHVWLFVLNLKNIFKNLNYDDV